MFRKFSALAIGLAAAIAAVGPAIAQADSLDIAPQHLDEVGLAGYREYLAGGIHRAFAIAPGGAWAWVSDMPAPGVAESEAIRTCSGYTEQRCMIYSADNQVVFDRDAWAGLWGPYATADEAVDRPVGTARGTKFPDLMLTSPGGEPVKLPDLRGSIVFLHIWGSWCAPCQVEFPALQGLYDAMKGDRNVAFLFIQSREDIEKSRNWAQRRGFSMPLYDSGVRGRSDQAFALAGGGSIEDRILAPNFPATYVLDSHGLIIFSHSGPLSHWGEYELFLRHASQNRPK